MQVQESSLLSAFDRDLQKRIRARRMLERLEALIACGDRFVGTDGDRRARDYVTTSFRQLGLEVQERPFRALGYGHTRSELALLEPGLAYATIPAYFSPATEPGGVEAELVYVAGGEAVDYEGLNVSGKIAVMAEPGLGYARFWMGSFAALAASRGALAVVVIHPLPWPYRMSMEAGNDALERRFLDQQIPVVSVSAPDGAQLLHAIGAGRARARLIVESQMGDVDSSNVSGVLAGRRLPDEQVLVVAHRDHGIYPGANDNGSGVATMLEIAAALAGSAPSRSIEFLNTTAEEGVTTGVAAYIAARRQEGTLEHIKAAIDLDMFGCGGKLKLVEVGHWPDAPPLVHSEWIMRRIEDVADALGYDVGRMISTWGVAESGRFLAAGVPAAWYWKPDDFYYHSPQDTLDKLDGNSLKAVADITAIVLWQLANAPTLPLSVSPTNGEE
jgi:aminopeptidase YwaD